MPESNEKGRVSFEEVAKLARTPEATHGPGEERSENSGLINLTAMVATETTSQTKIKETSVIPGSSHMSGTVEKHIKGAVNAALVALPHGAGGVAMGSKKQSDQRVWIALATGIALGVLVAGVFFAVRGSGLAHESPIVAAMPAPASATLPQAPAVKPNAPTTNVASDNRAADLSAAPQKVEPPARVLGTASHAWNIPPRDLSALPTTSAPPPTGAAPAKMLPTGAAASSPSQTPSVQGTDNTLEALIKRAVGPSVLPTPPRTATVAQSTPAPSGDVPVKPALGAVQGALGTVLPGARSCLGPDDPVSRATITFKSDGSVQNVAVSGHASGEPAEECIRSRLMAARVPPFASPTFTWTVTVRPAG